MLRGDFFEIVDYATSHDIGVKFSTNGTFIDRKAAERLATMSYLDVQVSLDGVDQATNDAVRGDGSYAKARAAMDHLAVAGFGPFKISVVMTRHNVGQLDDLKNLADGYGAQLRVTRLRPIGPRRRFLARPPPDPRPAAHDLSLAARPRRRRAHRRQLLPPQRPRPIPPGLNLCGAGRIVCLVDPVGDVYACPFVIHDQFRAGTVRGPGGFSAVWRDSELFRGTARTASAGACASCGSYDACQGGCMAAKFFTALPLDGPDPECVKGHGDEALAATGTRVGAAPDARPLPPGEDRHEAAIPVRVSPRSAGG